MSPPPPIADSDTPEAALSELLDRLAGSLHATRVLLWEADFEEDRLQPLSGPPSLEPLIASESPLLPALREDSPVPVDPAPAWARGTLVAARVDPTRLLSIETAGDAPDPEAVAGATRLIAPFLRLHDRYAHVVTAVDRADRLVGFLRSLQASATAGHLPDRLLQTALAVGGASGGVVASWIGHEGTVLAVAGHEGGPRPGTTFALADADLTRAAQTGAVVARGPDTTNWPVLGVAEERWDPAPSYRTVLPLIEPGGMTTGMIALWGHEPLAEQGTSLLEGLAPLLATQLRTAAELDRLRARAAIDAITGLRNRRALDQRLVEEGARFDRTHRPVSLVLVRLGGIERIRDSLGTDAGDAALREAASVVQAVVRQVDFPARYDHHTLALLLPETPLSGAGDVAERVRKAVASASIEHDGHQIDITAAIGVSACPGSVDHPRELIRHAEELLGAPDNG